MGAKKSKNAYDLVCDECGKYIDTIVADSIDELKKKLSSYNERIPQDPTEYYCHACDSFLCKDHVRVECVSYSYPGYGMDVDFYKKHKDCPKEVKKCKDTYTCTQKHQTD